MKGICNIVKTTQVVMQYKLNNSMILLCIRVSLIVIRDPTPPTRAPSAFNYAMHIDLAATSGYLVYFEYRPIWIIFCTGLVFKSCIGGRADLGGGQIFGDVIDR